MRGAPFFSVLLVAVIAFSHLGTIRKTKTAVQKTQSDSVSWKQREEELKDGPKGAPTPSFKLYGSKQILTEPPVSEQAKEEAKKPAAGVEEVDGLEEEDDWWSEEEEAAPLEEDFEPEQSDEF